MLFIGVDDDVEAAKQFIKNKYLSLIPVKERYTEKNIYPHFTCSVGRHFILFFFFYYLSIYSLSSNLDSKNIRIVFESVKDTVLAHNLYYWTPY